MGAAVWVVQEAGILHCGMWCLLVMLVFGVSSASRAETWTRFRMIAVVHLVAPLVVSVLQTVCRLDDMSRCPACCRSVHLMTRFLCCLMDSGVSKSATVIAADQDIPNHHVCVVHFWCACCS